MTAYPYQPFKEPIDAETSPSDEGDFICVSFARTWLPYVLGVLPALMARQTWEGDETAITNAVNQAKVLIGLFMDGQECANVHDIRVTDCVIEVQREPDGEWIVLFDPAECALIGP